MAYDESTLSEEKKRALQLMGAFEDRASTVENKMRRPSNEIVDSGETATGFDVGNAMKRLIKGQCRTVEPHK